MLANQEALNPRYNASFHTNKDFIVNKLSLKASDLAREFVYKEIRITAKIEEWVEWIRSDFTEYHTPISLPEEGWIHIDDDLLVCWEKSIPTVLIQVYGTTALIDGFIAKIPDSFGAVKNTIKWVYNTDGDSIRIPVPNSDMPIPEMYPFLKGESLESYYQRFIDSKANILLLIGEPGTGKTSFIKGLLNYAQENSTLTYDEKILKNDYFFARFIQSSSKFMIVEDADLFLSSRKDGNDMMHKFLNVGDGLVNISFKKMIFSTNLPSIKDIDPALIRPGRCFDILNFRRLDKAEAEALAATVGRVLTEDKKDYTIAEVFNKSIDYKESKTGI